MSVSTSYQGIEFEVVLSEADAQKIAWEWTSETARLHAGPAGEEIRQALKLALATDV